MYLLPAYACNTGTNKRLVSNGNEYDDWVPMNCKQNYLTMLVFVLAVSATCLQAQETVNWLTGTQLNHQARETAISLDWQNAPLRQRLSELTTRQRISVFLDRRIDGSREIRMSAVNVSFEELLWRLCDEIGAGMCRIDEVYYIGPRDTAAALPAEFQRIKDAVSRSQIKSKQRSWQRSSSITLAKLTEPKLTLDGFCRGVNCRVTNLDVIPHDLWAKTKLGNSSLTGRVALMLAGFDKSFELSEDLEALRIIDREDTAQIQREFQVGEKVKAAKAELDNEFPDLDIQATKQTILAVGTTDEVLAVHRKLVGLQRPKVAALSEQNFTIQTADKRGNVLASIANQISRKFVFDPSQTEKLNERIELQLKDATVVQLIEKTLEGSGLTYELTDEALKIVDR
jgi:hypothetical protein